MTATATTPATWHIDRSAAVAYRVLNTKPGHGWAVATIQEWKGGGSLDVQSDWGTFSHTWSAIGPETLRGFLTGLDYGYFMMKTRKDNGRVFDWDATLGKIRKSVLEARSYGEIDRNEARHRWTCLEKMEHTHDADLFMERLLARCNWAAVWCGEHDWCVVEHRDCPQCRAFWEGPWQALCEHWKAELAAERTKATTALITRTAKDADKLRRAVRAASANLDVHAITEAIVGRRYDRVIVTFRTEDPYPLPQEEEHRPGKREERERNEKEALKHLILLLPPGKRPEHMPLVEVYAKLAEKEDF